MLKMITTIGTRQLIRTKRNDSLSDSLVDRPDGQHTRVVFATCTSQLQTGCAGFVASVIDSPSFT